MTRRPTRQNLRNRIDSMAGPGFDDAWPGTVEIAGVRASAVDADGLPVEDEATDEEGENGAETARETDGDASDGPDTSDDEGGEEDGETAVETTGEDEAPDRSYPSFTINIPPDLDDEGDEGEETPVGECACGNPIYSDLLDGECVVCAGMPRRDWPEEIRDREGVDGHE